MSLQQLPDDDLIAQFRDSFLSEREELVRQLDLLGEMDRRKLFYGYESLWAFVVAEFGMDESAAERRIRAARLMKRLPEVRSGLDLGQLNVSLLEIAQSCAQRERLDQEGLRAVLEAVSGKSCRAARKELAKRYPAMAEEIPSDRIRPLTHDLSEVRFVAPQALLDQLEEIKGLLAHSHPGASLAQVVGVIASEYRERHHPEAKAARAKPSPSPSTLTVIESRQPSRALVHSLVRRDGFVCAYVDPTTSQRCTSTYGLQVDHILAWSLGGETRLDNLRYLCA